MINYTSFFNELEKIAEQDVATKDIFKRHLKAVAGAGIGTAIGAGLGSAGLYAIRKHSKGINDAIGRGHVIKHGPKALALIGAGLGLLTTLKDKKTHDYTAGRDERS